MRTRSAGVPEKVRTVAGRRWQLRKLAIASAPIRSELREKIMNEYRIERWEKDGPPIESDLKQQMIDEGFSVFQWSDAPGAVYPDHSHNDDQSHWLISGSIEFEVEGHGTVVLEAGDRDFMPAHTIHSARVLGSESAVYLIGSK